jgi:hypothetical protein
MRLRTPGVRRAIVSDLHRACGLSNIEDTYAGIVIGPIEQVILYPGVVRTNAIANGRALHGIGRQFFGTAGIADVDHVQGTLPTAKFLIAVQDLTVTKAVVQAFFNGQGRQGLRLVGVKQIKNYQSA